MWGSRPRRTPRRLSPNLERLDARELMAAGVVGHSIGPFRAPAKVIPRFASPPVSVNPHPSINDFLSAQLGSSITTLQDRVEASSGAEKATSAELVLSNPFFHSVFSRQDTFTLLNAVTASTLTSSPTSTADGAPADSVTYNVPEQARITVGGATTLVEVLPTATARGFFATVPTGNVRTAPPGSSVTATVTVPLSSIPSDAPLPEVPSVPTGPLSGVFTSTGPVILSAFQSSAPRSGPNAPRSVPGLRLASTFANRAIFPVGRTAAVLRTFRVAVDRNVFALSANQTNTLNAGIAAFEQTVSALDQAGTFTPPVPPPGVQLPRRPLVGTLAVSLGALRDLTSVAPSQTGFALPGVGNFPGRIDAGFVFDRNGNFGVYLTARGALLGAPPNVSSSDVTAGDVRIEASNAPNLTALGGQRMVEGLTQGVALAGGLEATNNANGVTTFAASTGYGSGLEFGTGVAYTQIIPLGNVYALIPEFPKG